MNYQVEVVDLPEQHGAAHIDRCGWRDIGPAIGRMLHSAQEHLQTASARPGVPFVLYRDPAESDVELVVGFMTATPVTPGADIQPVQFPACRAAKVVHQGDYRHLGRAHDALFEWARAQGYQARGGSWELYIDDPAQTPAEAVRTEVYLPLE